MILVRCLGSPLTANSSRWGKSGGAVIIWKLNVWPREEAAVLKTACEVFILAVLAPAEN